MTERVTNSGVEKSHDLDYDRSKMTMANLLEIYTEFEQ